MTTKIEKALSLGKINGAKALLSEYYLEEDKAQWLATKQEEYDVLYKTVQVQVEEELDEDGNVVVEASTYFEYVEDCPTFSEWLNETRVVSEEVLATYDEDGMELTPYQPEVTEQVRPYVASDVTELVEEYINNHQGLKTKAKIEALGSIVVTVNGVDYDAHQEAINNMSSVVGVAHTKYNQLIAQGTSPASAYETVYKSTIEWKGADNLPHIVQIESVVEALEQAMQKRAEIYGV